MDDDSCAWFRRNPSGTRVVSAITDSGFSLLFGIPAEKTCGVDIGDKRWGQSWHEVPETTVNDEIEWGNIQQSTRGRGADGMQGVWARRQGKYDCGNDAEERCPPRP